MSSLPQRRLALLAAVLLWSLVLDATALAQGYPNKPIRMVMVLGGGAEVGARLIAQHAGAAMGQPVIVEPQIAAGGSLGANAVAKAAPDGYTILYAAVQSQVYHPLLARTTPYDPIKDFTAVGRIGDALLCVVSSLDAPFKTFKEMIEYARRNPGKLAYSSSGVGTSPHLSGELVKQAANVDMLHVPFKGGAQQLTALMSGEVPLSFTILATVMSQINTGKVRLLAINNARRYSVMPGVPTIVEVLPGYEFPPGWLGLFGPAGMPQPIVRRLNAETIRALTLPEVKERLDQLAININPSTPEELAATLKRDFERAAALIKAAGIQPE